MGKLLKWGLIAFALFVAMRVVDKVDFKNEPATGTSGKPGTTVSSGGRVVVSTDKFKLPTAAIIGSSGASVAQAAEPAATPLPTVPPTPVVIQPSQEQLDAATKPLVEAATAAAEAKLPPTVVVATPLPTGEGYRMVKAPLDLAGTMKYGVIAKRPDGSEGVIWNLRGVPLSDGAQKELAGMIMTGLVRGDDVTGSETPA